MPRQVYIYKPNEVLAAQNTGQIDYCEGLIDWVKRTNPLQDLYFDPDRYDGQTGHMLLRDRFGTFDLEVNWWLVLEDGKFKAYEPKEFVNRFQLKE